MSIKQFYRSNIAFVQMYSMWVDGEAVNTYTKPVWYKGNVQPYKDGNMVTLEEALTRFQQWRVLYTKFKPEIDTTDVPTDAQYGATYFYFEGNWYKYQAEQDWTTAGRGVKHWKVLALTSKEINREVDVDPPVPVADLVENFEAIVSELNQTIPLILNNKE